MDVPHNGLEIEEVLLKRLVSSKIDIGQCVED